MSYVKDLKNPVRL